MNRPLTAAATGLLATSLLGFAGTAHADSGSATPAAGSPGSAGAPAAAPHVSAADPGGSTARGAASSAAALALAGRFFAAEGAHGASGFSASAPHAGALPHTLRPAQAGPVAAGASDTAHVSGPTVAVNTLNPAFVAGDASAPVATPAFWATKAVAADGRTASLWTVPGGATWKVVNIAAGADETDYAAKAAAGGGGTVFREPQINAWYVLRGGRVLPLDTEATSSVGAHGVSLAAYQRLVHHRYGDKLPGSSYDRLGAGGGYQPSATVSGGSGRTTAAVAGASALGLALAAAGAMAVRRSRAQAARP